MVFFGQDGLPTRSGRVVQVLLSVQYLLCVMVCRWYFYFYFYFCQAMMISFPFFQFKKFASRTEVRLAVGNYCWSHLRYIEFLRKWTMTVG